MRRRGRGPKAWTAADVLAAAPWGDPDADDKLHAAGLTSLDQLRAELHYRRGEPGHVVVVSSAARRRH